jgi:hypothetical protein
MLRRAGPRAPHAAPPNNINAASSRSSGTVEEGVIAFGGRIGRVKGRGSGSSNVVEPAPVHRDTNDTKSMASDIGTIRKGRMVTWLS